MRFTDNAPKGVMDYLFTEMLLLAKAQGYQWFSLGMAPLSGLGQHPLATQWHKLGNLLFRFGDNFYNFEGLRRYKSKFLPEWEPRYLASPGGIGLDRRADRHHRADLRRRHAKYSRSERRACVASEISQ